MTTNDRVLVTGGAGYIGSHVSRRLAADGYRPVTVDNLRTGGRSVVRWGPFELGDIGDARFLDEVMARYAPVAAVHLAGSAYVGESLHEPAKYYRNKVVGTLSLMEALGRHDVPHLVLSSSCSVYGVPAELPITEDTPLAPVSPYGASKAMAERIIADIGASTGTRAVSLRYFNAAGAEPDEGLGERHDPETHIVPLLLEVALGSRPSVDLFGDRHPTPGGTCIRDFVHVSDLADAHVLALRYLENGGQSRALNLGTGRSTSLLELVRAVDAITSSTVQTRTASPRPGDPPALVAGSELARSILGWQPTRSSIDRIVGDAYRRHRSVAHEHVAREGTTGPPPGTRRG
ncbi:UDP-glucose 4-epimerase GalE [Nitriliruptor alkaliphilus]|uniref:UDP-glucose 4-epimerase GalE n=1 Tax=Nitriliruptor alkaliphilus TaxID=427918 RepID=UPI0006964476|nr:UDP-glucose 4-epimerase GalE [Nitriliruptor alkaliphilus]